MLKTAAIVGVTSALWAAGQHGLSLCGFLIPKLNGLHLAVLAAGVYLTTGGAHTLWLAYHTLPRDLKAGIRFLKVKAKLKLALLYNLNVPKVFMENVRKNPNKVAFIYEGQEWTFAQVDEYSNRIGNFMTEQGFKHGDSIALYMHNRPEYVCTWLGCAKVGIVPALINFNLQNVSLVHSIKVANCKAVICGTELQAHIKEVLEELNLTVFISGCGNTAPVIKELDNLHPVRKLTPVCAS